MDCLEIFWRVAVTGHMCGLVWQLWLEGPNGLLGDFCPLVGHAWGAQSAHTVTNAMGRLPLVIGARGC